MNILLLLLLPFLAGLQANKPVTTAEYYYCMNDKCIACQEQLPVVEEMNEDGYDFKIIKKDYHRYGVTTVPAFVVVVKTDNVTVVTVKLENRHWSKSELKILVSTVNLIIKWYG